MRRPIRSKDRRRAFQVLELLLVLPILAVLLMAGLSYGKVVMLRAGLTHAAVAGAREAGKGGDIRAVLRTVNRVMAVYGIAISDARGSGTKLLLEEGTGTAAEYGDPGVSCVPSFALAPGEVRVTVQIALDGKKTDGKGPVVPWFNVLGFTFQRKQLSIGSLAKAEETIP